VNIYGEIVDWYRVLRRRELYELSPGTILSLEMPPEVQVGEYYEWFPVETPTDVKWQLRKVITFGVTVDVAIVKRQDSSGIGKILAYRAPWEALHDNGLTHPHPSMSGLYVSVLGISS